MSRGIQLCMAICLILTLYAAGPRAGAQPPKPTASQTAAAASASNASPTLDYEFFKTRVEPIFLKKRPDHARCYVCHEGANHPFKLAKLSPGSATWTEEESRRNFEVVSQLVTPGEPLSSMLLLHPLAPEAGGDPFHSGGRQFESQSDPDWKTIADWVRGRKTGQ